jgi:spore coat protein A
MIDRRKFLQASIAAAVASGAPLGWAIRPAGAAPAAAGLADPAMQFAAAGFRNAVPDALAPGFKFQPQMTGEYRVSVAANQNHLTGLVDTNGKRLLKTTIFGYSDGNTTTWPGKTFEVTSGSGETEVHWANDLFRERHMLPVDTSMHWCYSLPGYEHYSIKKHGIPIITHLHGGHTDYQFDGNPEFFYSPDGEIRGPQWDNVEGGFTQLFRYDNNVPAGNLWYHDHALGITRLNVYAGLAGFYFVRDEFDTGLAGNPAGLPAWPYEKAYAIQDRMFLESGELFYPAFPGDPLYDDFITGEGAILPPDLFPGGGPTGLAEFFGDHMVVNGIIWPKENVEPRNYRLHLLNGTDSRFMALQFFEVPAGETDFAYATGPLPFTVVGSDQGLASAPSTIDTLLSEPGSRYDVVFDFKTVTPGSRVIMKNIGGDEPFGGDIPGPQAFVQTDRVMAFDVVLPLDAAVDDVTPTGLENYAATRAQDYLDYGLSGAPDRLRKVALFEGKDEFGRLQPLLGTAEPATDYLGYAINWPDHPKYSSVGLVGQMEGSIAWHSSTTENPALNTIEEWEVWNVTGDAHPVHLHLVHFKILERQEIVWDSHTTEDDRVIPNDHFAAPAGDGTYLEAQPTVQHNSVAGDPATYGMGFKIMNKTYGPFVPQPSGYVENSPKDMVTALPSQITRIKAKFDKPGRYVWHCHILSHEDHEMMRVLHVGPGA